MKLKTEPLSYLCCHFHLEERGGWGQCNHTSLFSCLGAHIQAMRISLYRLQISSYRASKAWGELLPAFLLYNE